MGKRGEDTQGEPARDRAQTRVAEALVAHLYRQSPVSHLVNPALALILAALVAGRVPAAELAAWLVAIGSITGLRIALWHAYRLGPGASTARQWEWRLAATATVNGLTWAYAGSVMLRHLPFELHPMVGMMLAGLLAGAIPVLGVSSRTYLPYVASVVLPFAAHGVIEGGAHRVALVAMTLLYGGALIGVAHVYRRSVTGAYVIAEEKGEIARQLAERNDAVVRSNRRLAGEMAYRRTVERSMRESDARFRGAFANAAAGMLLVDVRGGVVDANQAFARMLGWTPEELKGRILFDLVEVDEREGRSVHDFVTSEHDDPIERRLIPRDGRELWGRIHGSIVGLEEHSRVAAVLQIQDVTRERELARALEHEARHDAVTGLANRAEFERRLGALLAETEGTARRHVLCLVDLDQFKLVNDTSGHAAGDQLLTQLPALFERAFRRSDLVARVGGDEFGVLMPDCGVDDAGRVAEKLRAAMEEFRFGYEGRRYRIGVSVGLVEIAAGDLAADLMRAADVACYAAKESGRNRVCVYDASDDVVEQRRGESAWALRIQQALDEHGFVLYAQPLVRVDGADEGTEYELLIRMRNPNGEPIPPGAFLPAAERYQVASRIDAWVVRRAVEWLEQRQARGQRLPTLGVNLSGQSLSDEGLLDFIHVAVRDSGVPPERLCFEVTETAAITNLKSASRFIKRMRSLGCRFALDDFGSGLSSFGYLRRLDVDRVKIDGAFVRDIAADPVSRAMVRSIAEIARVMGKHTVAEYVESDEILEVLAAIGIDFAQGHAIGRPRPLDELAADEPAAPVGDGSAVAVRALGFSG